jgi:AcrR family transcriptional regulator
MDRRARRHEETRQEILAAAWGLARERGLTGWSLRELANAVDLQAPSLYGYFDGKDAIYDAMFAQGYRQLLALDDGASHRDPVEQLRWAARSFVEFAAADPARLHLLFLRVIPQFEPSAASYALAQEVLGRLREWCAEAGLHEERFLDLWTATLTGLATQQVSNDPGGDRWVGLVDDVVDMLLASRLP